MAFARRRQGSTARLAGPAGGGLREPLPGVAATAVRAGRPRAARAMPRETLTRSPPPAPPPAGAAPSRDRARAPGAISPPWAPTPGTRKARPGATRPDGGQLGRGGGADDEAHGAARTPRRRRAAPRVPRAALRGVPRRRPRRPRGPAARAAPGFDVRHRTYANRSARSSSGAMASSPRYGFTVTASAPRTSYSATACLAAVDADVAPLRVRDERDVGGDQRAQPLERGHARRTRGPRRRRGSA